jgi:CheY-like chemotaxis protein
MLLDPEMDEDAVMDGLEVCRQRNEGPRERVVAVARTA